MTRKRAHKTDFSKMNYGQAVEHVALNESPGDDEALRLDHIESLVGVCLVADVFGVEPKAFAKDIIKFRRKQQ